MELSIFKSALQEIFYFNIWESLFMVGFVLIAINYKTTKTKFIFHILMLSILNYIIANSINIPILMQVIGILSYSLYFTIVFKTRYFPMLIVNIKVFFTFFVIEVGLAILYKYIFNIELISMSDMNMKFIYMIGFRIVEISYLFIYYKLKKRGENNYEKHTKNYIR